MSANRHTPGRWMSFDSGTMVITDRTPSKLVADVRLPADAHLIAAAPEMLELLRKVLNYGVPSLNGSIREVIAKAEGR
jgi:predicted component of type VI protein secretion system